MSQIIAMAKKLQDAEQTIARLQAASQTTNNVAGSLLVVSQTAQESDESSPSSSTNLLAREKHPVTVRTTPRASRVALPQGKASELPG